MTGRSVLAVIGLVCTLAQPMYADWDEGDSHKMHFPQLPDLGFTGIGVNLAPPYALADDFLCAQTGLITDIHIWAAWEFDFPPFGDSPNAITFTLRIHEDVPAGTGGIPYSRPGNMLWTKTYAPEDPMFTSRIWADQIFTGWLDLPDTYMFPINTEYWQYNFHVDTADAFTQQEGTIYWLRVFAVSSDPSAVFGWCTSADHWQDSATWRNTGQWNELLYPTGHASVGEPIDLAFVIDGEQAEPELEPKWTQLPHGADQGFGVVSDIDWPDGVPQGNPPPQPNRVAADDFLSDGRPIEALRWWGSYPDANYQPPTPVEPYVIDGWLIGFYSGAPDQTCPPDALLADPPPIALGFYFAPADEIVVTDMACQDCFGHTIFQYEISLHDCCVVCAETDPRTGLQPAAQDAFEETNGLRYWMSIRAVVGAEWSPSGLPPCQLSLTGHAASSTTTDGHFWGWHSSPADASVFGPLQGACFGRVENLEPLPINCWDDGDWAKTQWQCVPPAPPQVDLAFELLAPICEAMGDVNADGQHDVNDIDCFIDAILGEPAPGCWGGCGDMDGDGTANGRDIGLFIDAIL